MRRPGFGIGLADLRRSIPVRCEPDGPISGTFPKSSAPLAAPFHDGSSGRTGRCFAGGVRPSPAALAGLPPGSPHGPDVSHVWHRVAGIGKQRQGSTPSRHGANVATIGHHPPGDGQSGVKFGNGWRNSRASANLPTSLNTGGLLALRCVGSRSWHGRATTSHRPHTAQTSRPVGGSCRKRASRGDSHLRLTICSCCVSGLATQVARARACSRTISAIWSGFAAGTPLCHGRSYPTTT